jgi:hypothetical protein
LCLIPTHKKRPDQLSVFGILMARRQPEHLPTKMTGCGSFYMEQTLMSTKVLLGLCFALCGMTGICADTIAAGTTIQVRTNDAIDARNTSNGRVYSGTVDVDVFDGNNTLAIARGSDVELMVRDIGHHTLALDLDAVVVVGKRYSVVSYDVTRTGDEKDGIGANGRTGKFLGGGALFGTILGAVAGGGRGAGIGALAGGAAGAIGQVATRGRRVRVPAESVLTFQLQQPLNLVPDPGYTRDGRHYHAAQ